MQSEGPPRTGVRSVAVPVSIGTAALFVSLMCSAMTVLPPLEWYIHSLSVLSFAVAIGCYVRVYWLVRQVD